MKHKLLMLAMLVGAPALLAVDGVTLINQSTLVANGGAFTINQPGSYKLSGNLTSTSTVCVQAHFLGNPTQFPCVIRISASNVSLDLAGFTITQAGITIGGYNGSVPTAILIDPGLNNVQVRNGTIAAAAAFFGSYDGSEYYKDQFMGSMVLEELTLPGTLYQFHAAFRADRLLIPNGSITCYGPSIGLVTNSVINDTVHAASGGVCPSVGNSK